MPDVRYRSLHSYTANYLAFIGPYASGNAELVIKHKKNKVMGTNQIKGKPMSDDTDGKFIS